MSAEEEFQTELYSLERVKAVWKAGFQVKSEKMKIVSSGWLALVLIAGFSLNSYSEPGGSHGTAGKAPPTGTARPAAVAVPLPAEYDLLKAALEKVDSRGLTVKASVDVAAAPAKDINVSIRDVVSIRGFLEDNFKKYRQFLTNCAINRDRGADLTGKLLDGFITKLQTVITEDPKNATGLKEKDLITYVTQIERVLKEKASKFSASKTDFEKADEKLVDELKRTVGSFFGGYHGEAFDQVKQIADAETKPIVDEATAAMDAQSAHEAAGGKACKLSEEKAGDPGKAEDAPKEKEKEKAKEKDADKGKQAKLNPGPLEGGNPGGEGGTPPVASASPSPSPDTTPPGGGDPTGGNVPVASADPNIPFFDPGQGNVNQANNDFDADAILKGVLDRFKDLENQQKLDQDRAKQDLQNAVDAARRLGDDIARQNQAALDAQKNNDNGLADALGKLATQQQPPPPPPPAPPAPPVIPPQIPPSDSGQQAQQPFPPQDDGGQQPPPPQQQMPFFPPQQQSSAPIIIGEESKYNDDYERRRPVVVPQSNPQAGGMLELVRLQQQLMFAQQQAYQQQQNPNLRVNVNTMANRLGGAGGAVGARRVIPGRTTQANGTATQSSGVAGGRSTSAPSALRRGSLAQ